MILGRNTNFGRRVKQAREDLGCDRGTLAGLVGMSVQRLKLVEIGTLDDSDLSRDEKLALAKTLQTPIDLLVNGGLIAEPAAPYTVVMGQRPEGSVRSPVQQPLSYGPGLCAQCLLHSESSRCNRCGNPVE